MTEFETKLPLKLVKLPQNRGLGKALNEGLLHCAYDWVFRMDTDDICVPDRFEKQVAFIEQHPETIIFGGQIAEFGENVNDIVAYRNVPTSAQEIIKFTQKRCPFNHMTVAYQKSAVINCGGYEDLQEDYYLCASRKWHGESPSWCQSSQSRMAFVQIKISFGNSRIVIWIIYFCIAFWFSFIANLVIKKSLPNFFT